MFIDSHCHISHKYYDSVYDTIKESLENDVEIMIHSCCCKEDLEESVQLLDSYSCIYATFGFHPDQIFDIQNDDLEKLEEIIQNHKKIVGIGEIGLDYHYDTNKELQKDLFEKQLAIAERFHLPVVIHSREATKDTMDILKKYSVKGIIHCFSGSLETAEAYIRMGYKLGIGGVLTFKNSKLSNIVQQISLDHIVLETDSPYLTPDPYRGQVNSSKYLPLVAQKISEIKRISVSEVCEKTTRNCYEVFDLKA